MESTPQAADPTEGRFRFPRWFNRAFFLVLIVLLVLPNYLLGALWFGSDPRTLAIGYQPQQPVNYSHALHAGQLGLDCRYCHSEIEKGAHANIPATETCMACHTTVGIKRESLAPVRESFEKNKPIEWLRVHKLGDFVYFNHSAHVTRGVGCVSCHGRVDQMEHVYQAKELSMGWCLDCHRNPEPNLRPPELVTKMDYLLSPAEQAVKGKELRQKNKINPSTDCSTCHR
jgi:hypothetical protein